MVVSFLLGSFKNATGMNGGQAAARFWIVKAVETVVLGGAAKIAGAGASPAAAPAEASEAAAQKAAPTAPAAAAPGDRYCRVLKQQQRQ